MKKALCILTLGLLQACHIAADNHYQYSQMTRLEDGTLFLYSREDDLLASGTPKNGLDIHKASRRQAKLLSPPQWTPQKEELFSDDPVLFCYGVTLKSRGDKLFILYRNGAFRVLQVLNQDLDVQSFFKDKLVDAGMPKKEPVAILNNGIVALGEKGEFLRYDMTGKVVSRLIISKIFNHSRIIKPQPLPKQTRENMALAGNLKRVEDTLKFHADIGTKALKERDKTLPEPTVLKGDEFPKKTIAMENVDNANLLIMDEEKKLYTMNIEKATISPFSVAGFKLTKKGDKKKHGWEYKEEIIGIRVKNNNLYILTTFRMLHAELSPKPKQVGERKLPEEYSSFEVAWDVAPTMPPKFIFINPRTDKIQEFEVGKKK